MNTPLYRQAFSHSWHLAWRQPSLWPLGLFSAALGQMGLVDVLTQGWFTARGFRPGRGWFQLFEFVRSGFRMDALPPGSSGWVAFLLVVFAGIALMFLVVSVISQGALVDVTAHMQKRKQNPHAGHSWHVGVRRFWSVFLVHLFKKLSLIILGILTGSVALSVLLQTGMPAWVFLLVFLCTSVLGIMISFLAIYTVCYAVVEEMSFFQAVRSAWILFVEHWLVSIEVGLTIFALNIGIVCVLVTGLFVALVPAFLSYFFALVFSSGGLFSFGIAVSATLFLVFFFFIASVFSVFVTSVWTYLFMHMHKTGIKSHILHWLR